MHNPTMRWNVMKTTKEIWAKSCSSKEAEICMGGKIRKALWKRLHLRSALVGEEVSADEELEGDERVMVTAVAMEQTREPGEEGVQRGREQ